jgi:hypothetical protein
MLLLVNTMPDIEFGSMYYSYETTNKQNEANVVTSRGKATHHRHTGQSTQPRKAHCPHLLQ